MGMFSKPTRTIDYIHILLMHLLNHLAMFTLPVVILYLRDDYQIDYTKTGILWTALVVTNTLLSIFVGFYADTHRNRRYRLIYLGISIMIAGWFLIPLASSFSLLIPIFVLIGVGASMFHPIAFTLITEMFEFDKGKALSYNMAIGMAGTALAPLMFAKLVLFRGNYEKAILTLAIIFALIVVLLLLFIWRKGTLERIDWRPVETQHIVSDNTDIWFLLSPLILVPLIFTSIRGSFFKTSSLFTALLYEDYLHLSKQQAALATAAVLGFSSLLVLLGGWITDRFLPRVAIIVSSIGTLVSALGLVYLNDFSNFGIFSSFYFGLNAFYYIGSPAASALLANRTRPEQRGKLYGAVFSIGQVLSLGTPLAFGYINDNYGIRSAFFFILVLAAIAFVIGAYIYFEEKHRLQQPPQEESIEIRQKQV